MESKMACAAIVFMFLSGGFMEGENYIASIVCIVLAFLLAVPYVRSSRTKDRVEQRRRQFDSAMKKP